jgi:SAM-dependent methyltransferase
MSTQKTMLIKNQHHTSHLSESWRYEANLALASNLLRVIKPFSSVVDVGCGYGFLLAALSSLVPGLRIAGIDGPWVEMRHLKFTPDLFYQRDLQRQSARIDLDTDLVICLEVVEHLSPDRGAHFCRELCSYNCPILFSAAVPGQGGQGHQNEQFLSYWAGVFQDNGFVCIDVLHSLIWADRRLPFWLRQNPVLFYPKSRAEELNPIKAVEIAENLDRIHPDLYLSVIKRLG